MRVTTSEAVAVAVVLMGCGPVGPSVDEAATDGATEGASASEEMDAGAQAGSSGAAETGSTGGSTWTCPCDEVPAAWAMCEDPPTEAADALVEWTELVEIPEGNTRSMQVVGEALYMVQHEGNTISKAALWAWRPGDDAFEVIDPLGEDVQVHAVAAKDDGLVLLYEDRTASGAAFVSTWTPQAGLQMIVELDDDAFEPNRRGVMRIEGERALIGAEPRDWEMSWPEDAEATFVVDLAQGSVEVMPDPMSGVVPVDTGVWGRRPILDTYQYCFDYACFRPQVAIAWEVVTPGGDVVGPQLCVEDRLGVPVTDAWVEEGAYIYTTRVSVRRVDATGRAEVLWNGGVEDAWMDEGALWVSTSEDVDDGAPGQGRNALIRVDLSTGEAVRWLDTPVDDGRLDIHIVGRQDEQLLLSFPRQGGTRVLASVDVGE